MDYIFQPGERVTVLTRNLQSVYFVMRPGLPQVPALDGTVTEILLASGHPNADGIRGNRYRVKLDCWPRPLIFTASDVSLIEGSS